MRSLGSFLTLFLCLITSLITIDNPKKDISGSLRYVV